MYRHLLVDRESIALGIGLWLLPDMLYAACMSLHPDIARFAQALRELEAHLSAHGASGWAREIARCADLAEQSDFYSVVRFFGLFGGMGSLNDLVLQHDGQILAVENDRLQALLTQSYALADKLRREEP